MLSLKCVRWITNKSASEMNENWLHRMVIAFGRSGHMFSTTAIRDKWNVSHLLLPHPRKGNFRRIIHFPKKYTVEPLNSTNLGGRDPITRRVVNPRIGGGFKHKHHWVVFERDGPSVEGQFKKEKVVQLMDCGHHTAKIALVGDGDKLKYILATANMQPGDIIQTSKFIPKNPIVGKEGDAYPLGALSAGTLVNTVQTKPNKCLRYFVVNAGSSAVVVRKVKDRVIIRLSTKLEMSLNEKCMATIGQLSNIDHCKKQIGSARKLREMGIRPGSGLYQKKDGRFGRKIKPLPPLKVIMDPPPKPKLIRLTIPSLNIVFPERRKVMAYKDRYPNRRHRVGKY